MTMLTLWRRIQCSARVSEDWNLNEICIRKAIKCPHLNLI